MTTAAIIQARMSSTRLPGKVLLDIAGHPMLWHVVRRARKARLVDRVVVATSDRPEDDSIEAFCRQGHVDCFRGDESDVLDRFYGAARAFHAQVVVRLTADCPMLDPGVIDRVVAAYRRGGFDYVSNSVDRTYPDGLDTEVFSFVALERAWREARWTSEREHVTPYIWKHPELFRVSAVRQEVDLSAVRWTVDEVADLEFARAAYRHFGTRDFGMQEMLALLREQPRLADINAGRTVNEGYEKSLREDALLEPGDQR